MRNRQRSVRGRVGRALIVIVGVLGALAALDAVIFFVVLLAAAMFGGALSPYIGLLMFVALPFATVLGCALAWMAYVKVAGGSSQHEAAGHHVGV